MSITEYKFYRLAFVPEGAVPRAPMGKTARISSTGMHDIQYNQWFLVDEFFSSIHQSKWTLDDAWKHEHFVRVFERQAKT